MTSYTIYHQAYVKLALHAAKYPHSRVNGVLLGKSTMSDAVDVIDAVPLLHHWTSLSPSMEIGLDLARNHAQTLGLSVVGYYQASERVDDTTLVPVGERVAEAVRKSFPQTVAFVVDGVKLAAGEPALIPYLPSGTSWRPAPLSAFSPSSNFKLQSTATPTRTLDLIRNSNLHYKLGDFDDHLEDVSIDWLKNVECKDDVPAV
ncbi:UPF0172-domain-containing protein [Rickenella mellea]|uniref:UPF0172-domain-containing protein n=1 Tax=Rickenella mellea TaxID=50990 RepID=A0A4Y7Q8H3_9AGAM|nr:UPF0172-domain-containing protein [Rickenella mellea]